MARIVFATSRLPYPPREGHQLRSWNLLRALASRHEVSLLSFQRKDDEPPGEALRGAVHRFECFPIPSENSRRALAWSLLRGIAPLGPPFLATKYQSPPLRNALARMGKEADLVHLDILPMMAHADCIPAGVPVVYDAHNVEHALLEDRVRLEPGFLRRRFLAGQVARLRRFEASACRRADLVLACSQDDASALSSLAPGTSTIVIPNGVDLEQNRPAPATGACDDDDCMVFVGQMGWFPNRDGVEWFLDQILPRVLAKRTTARLVLVGKTEGLSIPDNVRSNVVLAGFVPDIRPCVHAAAVYIVPLRAGSGTRLKVLEAMALGKAIVTTSIGSSGIDLEHGVEAMFADDAEAFAAAILSLIESPERRRALGMAARNRAESDYGWDAIGQHMLARYDRLLEDAHGPPVQPASRASAPGATEAARKR